jgi:sugar (pentulose or hexulose) kinase
MPQGQVVAEILQHVPPESVITGWDFSTGAVKCLAFDLNGKTLAEVRLPTDLWTEGGVSELNLMQLEGQAHASVRAIGAKLKDLGRLEDCVAGGVSATHHTGGRIDANHVQVRRAICWNDHSLAPYHARGIERLGGQDKVKQLIGGPWAIRYTLSHLLKDETTLPAADWKRTWRILPHGALAAGFLTRNFDKVSVSTAASTGIMDLRTKQWCRPMLGALENPEYRELAWQQLPRIIDQCDTIGFVVDMGILRKTRWQWEEGPEPTDVPPPRQRGGWAFPILRTRRPIRKSPQTEIRWPPWIFPTSDDQQAGLVGGGAVDAGQMAVILGNSAVVNSSSSEMPASGQLDVMRLNWGPYLWMRCFNNGAQFLDRIVGQRPDWEMLEKEARACPPGADGVTVWPFVAPEPSLGVTAPRMEWHPAEPKEMGKRFRAALEALAYLIAHGVREHEAAGQKITRITVSGGIARSQLMCEILASVLDRKLERLQSDEGPALGAAVTALAALETYRRRQNGNSNPFTVADAVPVLVKFRDPVSPNPEWRQKYREGFQSFERLKPI